MTVVSDLQGILKLKVKPEEAQVAFAERLARKANDMDDDDWQGLARSAQYWVNGALEAIEKSQPVPLPSGIEALFKTGEQEDEDVTEKKKPAAKPKKAKAKSAKKVSKGNGRGPKGKFGVEAKIEVLPDANPFRAGSKCYIWFGKIKNGMTVPEAVEAGAPRHHIRWAHTLGHLKIS